MTPADDTSLRADPALVEAWMRARSLARGLPQPVPDHGGWRLETGSPVETRRYLFAQPSEALGALAQTISEPRVFLKLCGSQAEMQALLPPRWRLQPTIFMMTWTSPRPARTLAPPGYSLDLATAGPTSSARILTNDGELAASGYAAESGGVFIYDRIVVEPTHRRRGLGRALMTTLATVRRSSTATQVLVATAAGQALYETLGWTVHAPYTTAVIPDAS